MLWRLVLSLVPAPVRSGASAVRERSLLLTLVTTLPSSDAQRSVVVGGMVARHLARLCKVASQVGADSRDGRSGKGKPGPGSVPAPAAG